MIRNCFTNFFFRNRQQVAKIIEVIQSKLQNHENECKKEDFPV